MASHMAVLEDLLQQKKSQLDFIEERLEIIGIDPVTVTRFEVDADDENRQRNWQTESAEFAEKLEHLRQTVTRRNELIVESLRTLQTISESLEILESQ